MSAIATYVFFDIETTGLPQQENNRTRITEICFVAVKRDHLLETRKGCVPRVQQKLTLCVNPGMMVHPVSTRMTGLSNELLEEEPCFTMEVFTVIETFLSLLTKPICLIAHNGHGFDFPILKNHIEKLGMTLDDDLMCADCLHGFFDITQKQNEANDPSSSRLESTEESNRSKRRIDETNFYSDNTMKAQEVNEKTPKRLKTTHQVTSSPLPISRVRRYVYWNKEKSKGKKPDKSYKLKDVFYRLFNFEQVDDHRAENDCFLALKCAVDLREAFVQWVDENHCLFSEVKPMTPGRRLGY